MIVLLARKIVGVPSARKPAVASFTRSFDISSEHTLDLRVLDVSLALSKLQPPDDLQACISFEVADWVVNSAQPLKVTARAENGVVEISERHQKAAGFWNQLHSRLIPNRLPT